MRRIVVLLAVLVVLALSTSLVLAAPPAGKAKHGADGVGDPYFPKDGNGGYDVQHYDLDLVYEPDTGEEACIGCRLCEMVCPPAVIKVEMLKGEKRNYAKTFTLELYACEFCELCVQVCPTDAIVMTRSFDLSTTDRREMLLDKDRLHALGLQHQPSWATGNLLREMQGPPRMARAEAHAKKDEPSPAGETA